MKIVDLRTPEKLMEELKGNRCMNTEGEYICDIDEKLTNKKVEKIFKENLNQEIYSVYFNDYGNEMYSHSGVIGDICIPSEEEEDDSYYCKTLYDGIDEVRKYLKEQKEYIDNQLKIIGE